VYKSLQGVFIVTMNPKKIQMATTSQRRALQPITQLLQPLNRNLPLQITTKPFLTLIH